MEFKNFDFLKRSKPATCISCKLRLVPLRLSFDGFGYCLDWTTLKICSNLDTVVQLLWLNLPETILSSFQLNTAVESRQKRYRGSQQLGRSDSLDKMQMEKMASEILNWSTGEMQLLMHGVFQVTHSL